MNQKSSEIARVIGHKWSIPILTTLHQNGEMQWVDLRDEVGTSSKMLSDTLNKLVDVGLVDRRSRQKNTYYAPKENIQGLLSELENIGREVQYRDGMER